MNSFGDNAESFVEQIFIETTKVSKRIFSDKIVSTILSVKGHDKTSVDKSTNLFEWPTIEAFTIDKMIDRIKQFIKICTSHSTDEIVIEVNCIGNSVIGDDHVYQFKAMLSFLCNDVKPQLMSTLSTSSSSTFNFLSSIYFLVELSTSVPPTSTVRVTYRFANSSTVHCSMSSDAVQHFSNEIKKKKNNFWLFSRLAFKFQSKINLFKLHANICSLFSGNTFFVSDILLWKKVNIMMLECVHCVGLLVYLLHAMKQKFFRFARKRNLI